MPDAKFESDSFPSFGDMTSLNFPLKKGMNNEYSNLVGYLPQENELNLKIKRFYVQIRSFRPNIDPPCQFQQFSSRRFFSIFKIFETSG